MKKTLMEIRTEYFHPAGPVEYRTYFDVSGNGSKNLFTIETKEELRKV